ncbi:MAG: glutathione S-transferase family protein, partial [Woeseiaceae bacterium]
MHTNKPVLYVFAISHYCEKARWVLDYFELDYTLRYVAPGEHAQIAKRLGAPHSSVPLLSVGDTVIQGSASIVSWAERQPGAEQKRLSPQDALALCADIEKRIDEVAGVHIRRYYYSEALVEHPQTVRPVFTRDLRFPKNVMIRFAWPKIRKIMISRMDLGSVQGEEPASIVADELSWIDGLLADGKEYLVGGRFSRADIAVASLLSPLALPPEHPVYNKLRHPP